MSVSPGFATMIEDLLAPLGPIRIKRMFGGGGVYCGSVMFGLIADDVLYLKADKTTAPAFEAEGSAPFVYDGKGKPVTMSYWRLPERLYDEPDEAVTWGRRALGVARAAARK